MKLIFSLTIFALLSGCSTMMTSLPSTYTLSEEQSYIFGRFPLSTNSIFGMTCRAGIALVLASGETEEYFLSFDTDQDHPGGYKIFEVPPAEYRITEIAPIHDRNGKDTGSDYGRQPREEFEDQIEFDAQPGAAYYIGDYLGKTSCSCDVFTTCFEVSGPTNLYETTIVNIAPLQNAPANFRTFNTVDW